MDSTEIIEKIRAEVNRLWNEHPTEDIWDRGYNYACEEIMSFLSDLEKSEKPIDGLEDEIDKRWKEWLSDDKEQVEGVLPKSEFAFYARHFYELGRQSKKKELLPMIERICVSCPEKVKAESALNKFTSKYCVHCSIEHCPGVKACYTSSNKQLQ